MTKSSAKARIKKLREEINHQRYLYHVKDTVEISSAALDSLKKELTQLEEIFPDLVTPDSPTQRVGGKPLPQFAQVAHNTRMLSLNDVFSYEELVAWEKRNQKLVAAAYVYFAELKIDGVAVSLIYTDSLLQQAATRGDGFIGEDVTHNIKTIEAIPLRLRLPIHGRLEVRGEVYIAKIDLEKLNQEQSRRQQPVFANPRNLAAGSIRQLDPMMAASRPLKFFAWEITQGAAVKSRQEEYERLQSLGFPVPPDASVLTSLAAAESYLDNVSQRKDKYPFLVDGAVIKINNLALSRRLGVVGKSPRASVAYKFAAVEATTTVQNIVVQIGRTGVLTPVAVLQPVRVAGTLVSRATLHNAAEIRRKDIRLGDTVIVRKAGDIIPEVVQSLPKLRPANTPPFHFPKKCPVCTSPVTQDADGIVWRCGNQRCFPVQRERILHAVSRAAFDIEGLGEKIVEQMLQAGLIEDAADLWQLTAGDLLPLERFAAVKANKIIRQIQAKKVIALSRFLLALSIPQVGAITAQDLSREFKTLAAVKSASAAKLQTVEGIGKKVAHSVNHFFANPTTAKLLLKYRAANIIIKKDTSQGPLAGASFIFTGSLGEMTREEAKQRVLALGGKVVSVMGRRVNFVVVGEKAGSKVNQALQLGLKQLTPDQFRQMIGV